MFDRFEKLSAILHSPVRILGLVLLLIFSVEVCVMLLLPYLIPNVWGETVRAVIDAVLLTLVCAPVLWWVIIGPLRRIAIQEHQRSETIVANAGEGIVTFDPLGKIQTCNRALTGLLATDATAIIGRSIHEFFEFWPDTLPSTPQSLRMTGLRQNGERFPVEISISEYPSQTGRQLIAIARDLTDSERAEAHRLEMARESEALRAQQMATLAQVATGVAHEIRNPLTSIKLLIQVNRQNFASMGLPADDLELVEHEIRRMERSVSNLLDYARPEQGHWETVTLQRVIQKTVQLLDGQLKQRGVELLLEGIDQQCLVYADAAHLQQLLLNLALNGIDAMPHGGRLTISCQKSANKIHLTVRDTGVGLRAEVIDKLFTPFTTTKPNGVGLGLSICRRIAEAHGGDITFASHPEGGTEFRVSLPIAFSSASDHGPSSEVLCNVF